MPARYTKIQEPWFTHHPTPVLLVLAGVGLFLSIWSLSDVAFHATRMAAVQDAALLADSIKTLQETYQGEIAQEFEAGTSPLFRPDGDPDSQRPSVRQLSAKFAGKMAGNIPGSRVRIHEDLGAFIGSNHATDSKDFLAQTSNRLREEPAEAVAIVETRDGGRFLRYVVGTEPDGVCATCAETALGSSNQNESGLEQQIIDLSIPLDSQLVIDSKTDISQGLVFFSFLSLMWFGVAGLTLIASREKSRKTAKEAERYRSLSSQLQLSIIEEEETRRANDRLQTRLQEAQKIESLSVLAGGLAHDFNNLLVPILANADLLKSELVGNSLGSEMLDDIDLAANRASGLCQQMLAYAGKTTTRQSHLYLNSSIEKTTRILGVNVPKNCNLELDLAKNLPFVEADPSEIEQVMLNLVTNASEAIGSRSGSIQIRTGVCDLAPSDSSARKQCSHEVSADGASGISHEPEAAASGVFFEVFDDGIGMSEETQKKIFDPFYSTKFAGRGLGLAAVQGILRSHGGSIQVESELGRFTRIRVELPVASDRANEGKAGFAPGSQTWKGEGRILLADDESAVQGAARRILNGLGFEVLTADDGEMATRLFALDPQSYTACLFDVTMPRLDGIETLHAVRRLRADIPVLLFSGYTERSEEIEGLRDHQTGFLEKPFRTHSLVEKLKRLLEIAPEAQPQPAGEPAAPVEMTPPWEQKISAGKRPDGSKAPARIEF
jgi:signal transduction histidine kinase/CheY-like chemotaxis protein